MRMQFLSIRDSLLSGLTTFVNFIPTLIGAAILLAVGWILATGVARLVERILISLRLDQATMKTGLDRFLVGPYGNFHASRGVGFLAKWFIRLIFIQAAANLLQMPQITTIINSILLFIPNIAVALVIVVAGAYLARFASGLVYEATSRTSVSRPDLFSMITRYAIMGFTIIAALNHLDVAVLVVNTLLIGLVASLSLALGLAFGLGGQHVASEVTRNVYEHNKASRLKAVGEKKPA